MQFQLHIKLTEEEYLAFNHFHALESAQGKQIAKKSQSLLLGICAVFMVFILLMEGFSYYSLVYFLILALFAVFYLLSYESLQKRGLAAAIKRMKKNGKLPFDADATFEFYDDKMVEITPFEKAEKSYQLAERICVVRDRFILVYLSSATAFILPIAQVDAQVDTAAFIQFLSEKCPAVEYH